MGEHREQVARALGCQGEEVYFTSGGTEGDNWAVALAVHLGRHKGRHIITTAIAARRGASALQGVGAPGI